MRLAGFLGDDNVKCPSRKVGCIITDIDSVILGTGYNGSPRKTPEPDSYEYIKNILWPKLTETEKQKLSCLVQNRNPTQKDEREVVAESLHGCGQCPRRLLGHSSGVRTELCSCQHGERNAISNSNGSVAGGILFGHCCISCFGCTGAIINSRIKEVHFQEGPEYEPGCIALYGYANIPIFLYSEEELD